MIKRTNNRIVSLVCIFSLFSLIINCCEAWNWPGFKGALAFSNNLDGELLLYHCYSDDDDFGRQTLHHNELERYDFNIFDTYIKCNFWWGNAVGRAYGEGYEMYNNGEWGSNVDWVIRKEGVAAGALLLIIMVVIICVICIKKKKRQHKALPGHKANPIYPQMMNSGDMSSNFSDSRQNLALGLNKTTFTYAELEAATEGFSKVNLLGGGGFGYVHKGLLPDGKEVAVKSLTPRGGQGEKEFRAEVEIIGRIHHRHLVSLVGYCLAPGKRLLVYKYVPNRDLHYHLHENVGETLNWEKRMAIAIGTAKGLAYLHEDCQPCIIHRDIKPTNILLDNNHEAKVADFGLARLAENSFANVRTSPMGTVGYIAPEYHETGKISVKYDIFSFGVVLLELITGRRPINEDIPNENSLVEWARPLLKRAQCDGHYHGLVDQRLDNEYNNIEMARMVACAAASIRKYANRRPKMSQILHALKGDVSLEILNSTAEYIMTTLPVDI